MENEKELNVVIDGITYVPLVPPKKTQDFKEIARELEVVLNIVQTYIDNGRELLDDYKEANLKISHVEAEGFTRAAVSIYEHIEDYKRNFIDE